MKIKWYTFLLLVLLIVTVFASVVPKNSAPIVQQNLTAGQTETSLIQREVIQKSWVDALYLAADTGNTEAKAVVSLIENKISSAIPAVDGMYVADQSKPIRLLTLLPEDARYPLWKSYLDEKGAGAWFVPELHAIVLRDMPEYGTKTKGAILTHEGVHALRGSSAATNETEYGNEERDTYSRANSLIESFGGKAYLDFRAERIANMFKNMKTTNEGTQLPTPDASYAAIGDIIGPFANNTERSWWVATAWIDVTFHFIDQHSSGTQAEKDAMKSEVIVWMTKSLGLIPKDTQ
ncbi:MAG: hypothetical protein NT098_04230 [Candidatus Parcubacteria bacterium]|nr:hypothetical protein [Candidatus Parcubacteria bacterium]